MAEGKSRRVSQIWVFLFGNPAWEMELEGVPVDQATVQTLEQLGEELRERLIQASKMTKTLLENGWSGSGGLYEICFSKEVMIDDAKKEFVALGLNPDAMNLEEGEWKEDG